VTVVGSDGAGGATAGSGHPRLSIIIQFFNRRSHVRPIAEALVRLRGVELIVCDDGSIDGSHDEWLKYLTRSTDVLIRSNDIHEIRAYDRAASLARGDILCFLQDDDIPPTSPGWVDDALALFTRYPRLGLLGGYRGREFSVDSSRPGSPARIDRRVEEPSYVEPAMGIHFMFVQSLDLAPLFVRRETYIQTGIDLRYSKAGESGIVFDQEICLHGWRTGWHVGLYRAPFNRRVGGRGTFIFSKESRERNFRANLELLGKSYGDEFDSVKAQADGLNRELLRTVPAGDP